MTHRQQWMAETVAFSDLLRRTRNARADLDRQPNGLSCLDSIDEIHKHLRSTMQTQLNTFGWWDDR